MGKTLLIVYFLNIIALTLHEIDSAFWKEWNQFNKAFGWFAPNNDSKNVRTFLLLHIPLLGIMFWGLLAIYLQTIAGIIISLLVAAGGVFAFFFHGYFIKRGFPEFASSISRGILWTTLILSLCQLLLTSILAVEQYG